MDQTTAEIFARHDARIAAAAASQGLTFDEAVRLDQEDIRSGVCRHCGISLKDYPGHEPTICGGITADHPEVAALFARTGDAGGPASGQLAALIRFISTPEVDRG